MLYKKKVVSLHSEFNVKIYGTTQIEYISGYAGGH